MREKEADREALVCAEREIEPLREGIIPLDELRAALNLEKDALRAALDRERGGEKVRGARDRAAAGGAGDCELQDWRD
jgi:hypothetical protein